MKNSQEIVNHDKLENYTLRYVQNAPAAKLRLLKTSTGTTNIQRLTFY